MPDSAHETLGAAVARVLPDVTGLDKEFDYLIPDDLVGRLAVGEIVRVRLHGRSVRGWVTALDPSDGRVDASKLQPIVKRASMGPAADLVDLARWASVRWAAGRLRPFLVTASPPVNVSAVNALAPGPPIERPSSVVGRRADDVLADGGGVLLLPPASSPIDAIVDRGDTRVDARRDADRRRGPRRWRRRCGAAVCGPRSCRTSGRAPPPVSMSSSGLGPRRGRRAPSSRCVVVIDEHDETLQEERSPTWHARDVLVERARRAGVPLLATSPCPSVTGVAALGDVIRAAPGRAPSVPAGRSSTSSTARTRSRGSRRSCRRR